MATWDWSSNFEGPTPGSQIDTVDDTDLGSDLDEIINQRMKAIRERANVEHDWSDSSIDGAYSELGRHNPGSARAFFGTTAPTTLWKPDGTAGADTAGTPGLDDGRLWVDSDDNNRLYVRDAAAWELVNPAELYTAELTGGDWTGDAGTELYVRDNGANDLQVTVTGADGSKLYRISCMGEITNDGLGAHDMTVAIKTGTGATAPTDTTRKVQFFDDMQSSGLEQEARFSIPEYVFAVPAAPNNVVSVSIFSIGTGSDDVIIRAGTTTGRTAHLTVAWHI